MIDGKRTDAIEQRGIKVVFRLPNQPRSVRVRSRVAAPQELGLARDPRPLGVSVRRIVLARAQRQRIIDADAAALVDGYHAFEPENRSRWTNGDAALPTDFFASMDGPSMLILHLGGRTRYLDERSAARVA